MTSLRRFTLLTAGIYTALYATAIYADEVTDTMVVTASGYSQQLRDAPASITVITQEQLRDRPVHDLADAVKGVEGVSIVGSANKQDINIRGLPGEYTLILVDGRRQNSRESRPNGSGGFEASFMPPVDAIERIEVIRGPMSSLYGSDAMGGVINIITKKVTNEWHGSLSMGGTLQENLNAGNTTDSNFYLSGPLIDKKLGLQLYGGGDYRQEDAIIDGHNKRDNKNLTAKLTYTPWDNQTFLFEAGRTIQERLSTPGKSIGDYANRAGAQRNQKTETHNDRNHWALTYKGDWDIANTEMSVYQERTKRSTKNTGFNKDDIWENGYEARTPEITNTVVDGKVVAFLPDNILSVGGQYQYASLKDSSAISKLDTQNAKLNVDQYALFVENEFTATDNLILTGGLRLDHHEVYGNNWNPRGYAIYHLTDEITIKGGISKAFRAPTLREISPGYGTSTQGGNGVIYGNKDLKPETSVNEEIGIAYDHESGFSSSLTLFNTDFKNKLTSYSIGEKDPIDPIRNLYIYDNVGKANIKGVEFASKIPLIKDVNLSLNYTYTDSERKSDDERIKSGESLRGYPLDKTPKHSANAKLDWNYSENLQLYTRARYEGEQVWAAQRNSHTAPRYRDAYTTLDVGLTYDLLKNTQLSFAILNIGNEKGPEINEKGGNWDIEDGRRYWANAKISF